jgi:hypothetical protein
MSKAEPCPECEGKCCRDSDFGGRVYHMGAESYYHWCDHCQNGDKYVPPLTYEQGVTDGERRATAAVVAWLRREIQKCGCDDDTAACIERGEHRREDEP